MYFPVHSFNALSQFLSTPKFFSEGNILTNSELIINNNYQLDLFISIASMLIKKPFIFNVPKAFEHIDDNTYLYSFKRKKNNNYEYLIKDYFIIKEWI